MASPIKLSSAIGKPRPDPFRQEQVAAFYLQLRSPLSLSLRRWNLQADEVEDVVQDAFLRLLSHGPEDLNADSTRYWLFRVAHNLAIDRQRSGFRTFLDPQADFDVLLSLHHSPHFNPEKIYLDQEQWRLVQNSLSKLTPRQQQAIYLRIVGFSYKTIAQQLKGTANSVGELIRRGLKRLGDMAEEV